MTDDPAIHALHLIQSPPVVASADMRAIAAITGPAAQAVLRERMDQVERHGFDTLHDDAHNAGEIAEGAIAYALHGLALETDRPNEAENATSYWPFADMFRPTDAIACYVKAAAMLMAEADRIHRARALLAVPS
jgi:hypothetical protein